MKKYEIVETMSKTVKGKKVYRIKALRDILPWVDAGEYGGWVESEKNLSQEGNCWVMDNAVSMDNAEVTDDACITDTAIIQNSVSVSQNVVVAGNSKIKGSMRLQGKGVVINSNLYGNTTIGGHDYALENGEVTQRYREDG